MRPSEGATPLAKRRDDSPVLQSHYTGLVVGWTHNDLGTSIDLHFQSTSSKQALNEGRVDSHHFLMTHNQGL